MGLPWARVPGLCFIAGSWGASANIYFSEISNPMTFGQCGNYGHFLFLVYDLYILSMHMSRQVAKCSEGKTPSNSCSSTTELGASSIGTHKKRKVLMSPADTDVYLKNGNDELKKLIGGYVWVITEILFLALPLLSHKGQGNTSIFPCIKSGLATFINLP